jgi:ankyrin repeat protein
MAQDSTSNVNVVQCAQVLLNIPGTDVNTHDRNGYTVLMCAVRSNRLDPVRVLWKNGAHLNAVATSKHETAMHHHQGVKMDIPMSKYYPMSTIP